MRVRLHLVDATYELFRAHYAPRPPVLGRDGVVLSGVSGLVDQLPNVELRVVHPDIGRPLMNAHRTPDGRAATPTVILLDAAGNERGCFIERPAALRDLLASVPSDERFRRKMAWYAEDAGRQVRHDVAAMLEAASRGDRRCE